MIDDDDDVLFGLHGMHLVLARGFVLEFVLNGCIYLLAKYPMVSFLKTFNNDIYYCPSI